MGGASPYRGRFINGHQGRDDEVSGEGGEKYFGLVNLKNTCYVNSVLQALYFCNSFRRAAIRQLELKDDSGGESLLTSLAELFSQIEVQKRNAGSVAPRRFLTRLRKANELFNNCEHQDAHEFLQFLLNDISESAKKRLKMQREKELSNTGTSSASSSRWKCSLDSSPKESSKSEARTWVHDILQGHLVNQMRCLCCENVTVRREEFFDLSLDIEQHTSIAACLRAFESTERLKSNNKFFCDTCGCLQEAEKRLRIYQLPNVLVLHLKRFKYVERLGRCCRLPYRVVFPLQLRVVEHRDKRRRCRSSSQGGGRTLVEASPGLSDEDTTAASQPPSRLFELRSVVVHIGRDSSYGHYVTIVRNGQRCVLLDDDVVRVVDPKVLRSFYGTAGNSATNSGSEHAGGCWSSADCKGDMGNRPSSGAPLYERAPEGTCCGYLLMYEAVDEQLADQDRPADTDWGNATDWLSEDRDGADSDSENSIEEQPGKGPRQQPSTHDDGELTQAFEQRCVPGSCGTRFVDTGKHGCGSSPAATSSPTQMASPAASPDSAGDTRAVLSVGSFGWVTSDSEGGRTPQTSPQGGHGARPLGSVVPATSGSLDAVSLSRVNVVTVPSPSGSLRGVAEGDRGA